MDFILFKNFLEEYTCLLFLYNLFYHTPLHLSIAKKTINISFLTVFNLTILFIFVIIELQ